MTIPNELRYTINHEWVRIVEGGIQVGITDFAQEALGDIVFVSLPTIGDAVAAGDSLCDVESVKAVSSVYAPLGGTVVAVNEELETAPEMINSAPYEAYIAVLSGEFDVSELLDATQYAAVCEKGH